MQLLEQLSDSGVFDAAHEHLVVAPWGIDAELTFGNDLVALFGASG